MGSPGKVVRELSQESESIFLQDRALGYVNNARRFKKETVAILIFGIYSGIRGTVFGVE